MKPNFFLCLMAVILSSFIGYFLYNAAEGKSNDTICGIVSLICMVVTIIPLFGIKYESYRLGINLKVLSSITLVILLAINVIYAYTVIKMPNYLIINGIIVTLYVITFYSFSKIKDI